MFFSMMFVLIMFVFIILAILDSNYQHLGVYFIFAAYGIIHLITNMAFKTGRKWGKTGLLTLYSLWILYSVFKALVGHINEMSLVTAIVVSLGSAVMVALLVQDKPDSSQGVRQTV